MNYKTQTYHETKNKYCNTELRIQIQHFDILQISIVI